MATRDDKAAKAGKDADEKKPPRGARNYKGIALRMRQWEDDAIRAACEAIATPDMKIEMSQLFYTAALDEAQRLGFSPTQFDERTIRRKTVWPYVPERPEGTRLEERTTVSIHPLHLRTIEQAASSIVDDNGEDVPLPLFLIGSCLRFIGARQKKEPSNRALQAVKLPAKFQKG